MPQFKSANLLAKNSKQLRNDTRYFMEINEEEQVPCSKELAVMRDEKRESMKVGFKTGANSTSLNAKRLKGNNAERRTPRVNNAIKG